jgi:sugar phosphate isomerase/epimerase
MPLPALHATLGEVGYRGYYTVDLFRITEDPLRFARESLTAMRALMGTEGG